MNLHNITPTPLIEKILVAGLNIGTPYKYEVRRTPNVEGRFQYRRIGTSTWFNLFSSDAKWYEERGRKALGIP